MKRVKRLLIASAAALMTIACTDFKEKEYIPESMSTDEQEISFESAASEKTLVLESGLKWKVDTSPEWLSFRSAENYGTPYRWLITLVTEANAGYDREGEIVFATTKERATVKVSQSGAKGKYIQVTGVTVTDKLTLTEGEEYTLEYSVEPANASDKSVRWESSDTSVVTVDENGVVTAVKEGSATVKITTNDGNKTATCSVTVNPKTIPVAGVSLDKTELNLVEGESFTLKATVTPEDATDKSVSWKSSQPTIATVDNNGKVTAVKEGTAVVTVTTKDGNKTASCAVTVVAKTVSVTGVSLDKTELTITEGKTETLKATVYPDNASDKNVTWKSSQPSIATVDDNGKVTAVKEGTAVVTVTTNDGNKTATCAVTVVAKTVSVSGVSLDKTELKLIEGEEATLVATVTPADASDKSVTWKSSQPSIATVDENGKVTAVKEGTAVVTVTTNDGGKTASCAVTVEKKVVDVTGVSVDIKDVTLTEGENAKITVTIEPADATDQDVTFTSSDESVATVDADGNITAVGPGTATITVTAGGKTATTTVTVNPATVPVTGVTVDITDVTLTVGEYVTITATIEPADATDKNVTYTSSDESVATVDENGKITAVGLGTATITVTAGGKTATTTVTVSATVVAVTGVSLDKTELTLTKGDNVTLVATVEPVDATNKEVTWSSNNTSVATVDKNGKVTGVKAGTATITVTTKDGGKTATCSVTVILPPDGQHKGYQFVDLGLSVYWATYNVGASTPDGYGNYFAWGEIVPKSTYTWTTYKWCNGSQESLKKYNSSSSYGTVDDRSVLEPNDDAAHVKWGGYWRIPTNNEWKELRTNCTLTWTDNYNGTGIAGSIVTSNKTGYTDKAIFIPASGAINETGPKSVGEHGYYWSSSVYNKSYSAWGLEFDSGTSSRTPISRFIGCPVRPVFYDQISVTSVSLNTNSIRLAVGATQQLKATVLPDDASNKSVSWSSSNATIATVDQTGLVKGIASGNATITVTTDDGAKTASCSVEVYSVVSSVSLNKTSLSLYTGDSEDLVATIEPAGADQSVTWSSSNTSVAIVSNGKVTAVSPGSAVITAASKSDPSKKATCAVTVTKRQTELEAVDLGLSVKWANLNLGASNPEEYGEYFAWGETEPKTDYSWATYKFELGTDDNGPFSKYVTKSSYGTVDNKTVLDPEDDAAHVNWGGSWRMPTDEEWTELRTNCTWTWTTQNGVNGRLVTGPNGKSIFLPAAGSRRTFFMTV